MDAIHLPKSISQTDAFMLRYGDGGVPAGGPWNDVIASLLSHPSFRSFRPDALQVGTLELLVAAAQSASTSSNSQTWLVVSVADPAKKAALAKLANNQNHIEQCPLFLVWPADVSRDGRLAVAEGVNLETASHFETYLVAAIDAALAAQNATMAAESLRLSMVYIDAPRINPVEGGRLLGLPLGAMGVFRMCIGYPLPSVTKQVKPRLPQSAILFHDRYDVSTEHADRVAYDTRLAAFSQQHDLTQDTWTKRVIARMGKISAMNGRENLVPVLNRMGFPLS